MAKQAPAPKPNDQKQNVWIKVLGIVFSAYKSCFKAEGLAHVAKCAAKCLEITGEKGFAGLQRKSSRLIQLLRIPAISLCALIVYLKLIEGDYLFIELGKIQDGLAGLSAFSGDMDANKELLDKVIPNANFISNLISTFTSVHTVLLFNFIAIKITEGLHPYIKKSRHIKEVFVSKGWSEEKSEYFLFTKTGILVEIPKAEGKTVLNDGIFWRDLDRTPKEPIECQSNRKIMFIGNGFKLSKVEFKVK